MLSSNRGLYLAIGGCLAFLLLAIPALGQKSVEPQDRPAQSQESGNPDQAEGAQESTQDAPPAAALPATEQPSGPNADDRQRAEEGQGSPYPAFQWDGLITSADTIAQWAMAFFGIAATVLSGIAVYLLKRTLEATRDAVDEARNGNALARESMVMNNRAWVALEEVSLLHPTKITEDVVCWNIQATGKNLGRTPAINTTFHFEPRLLEGSEYPFRTMQDRFVEGMRRKVAREHQFGPGLFPDEPFVVKEMSWMEWGAVQAAIQTNPVSGERYINTVLFVGVGYMVVGDERPHVTYRPYGLLSLPLGTTVPEDQRLEVRQMQFQAGITD